MASSWRTTASGLSLAVGLALGVILPKFGIFTESEINDIISAALILVGVLGLGVTARDDSVTSEGRIAPKALRLLLFTLLFLPFVGCTAQRVGGVTDVTDSTFHQAGDPSNTLVINPSGQVVQRNAAEPTNAAISDPEGGLNNYAAVPLGTLTTTYPLSADPLDPRVVRMTASVPNDMKIDSAKFTTPDGNVLELGGVSVTSSTTVTARAGYVEKATALVNNWTDRQAEVIIKQLEEQAALGEAWAQDLLPVIRTLITGQ